MPLQKTTSLHPPQLQIRRKGGILPTLLQRRPGSTRWSQINHRRIRKHHRGRAHPPQPNGDDPTTQRSTNAERTLQTQPHYHIKKNDELLQIRTHEDRQVPHSGDQVMIFELKNTTPVNKQQFMICSASCYYAITKPIN